MKEKKAKNCKPNQKTWEERNKERSQGSGCVSIKHGPENRPLSGKGKEETCSESSWKLFLKTLSEEPNIKLQNCIENTYCSI